MPFYHFLLFLFQWNDTIVFIPVVVVVIPMLELVLIPNRFYSVYSSSVQFLFMKPYFSTIDNLPQTFLKQKLVLKCIFKYFQQNDSEFVYFHIVLRVIFLFYGGLQHITILAVGKINLATKFHDFFYSKLLFNKKFFWFCREMVTSTLG